MGGTENGMKMAEYSKIVVIEMALYTGGTEGGISTALKQYLIDTTIQIEMAFCLDSFHCEIVINEII